MSDEKTDVADTKVAQTEAMALAQPYVVSDKIVAITEAMRKEAEVRAEEERTTLMIARLHSPFPMGDLEWRVLSCDISKYGRDKGKPYCKVVPYINSRAVMARLDTTVGPSNWGTKFRYVENNWQAEKCRFSGGFMCELSLFLYGRWVTKTDGANPRDTEPFKSCFSDALKRAAVHWGIGRYLYSLPTQYGKIVDKQFDKTAMKGRTKGSSGVTFYWLPPLPNQLPRWMQPPQKIEAEATDKSAAGMQLAHSMRNHLTNFKVPEGVAPHDELDKVLKRIEEQANNGGINKEQHADIIENYYKPCYARISAAVPITPTITEDNTEGNSYGSS